METVPVPHHEDTAAMARRKRRVKLILLLMGVLIVPILLLIAVDYLWPPPKIRVSRETTHFDGPRRPDGSINFEGAIHNHFSEHVTPEENAAVLLYEALGPVIDGQRVDTLLYHRLGMTQPPMGRRYFQPINEIPRLPDGSVEATQFKAALQALSLVRKAVERPKYYSPLVPPLEAPGRFATLTKASLAGPAMMRKMGETFAAQARIDLLQGDVESSLEDLMTCQRLGRLLNQGVTTVEQGIGIDLEELAISMRLAIVKSGLSRETLDRVQQRLAAELPPLRSMDGVVDITERAVFLDLVSRMQEPDFEPRDFSLLRRSHTPFKPLVARVVDHNVAMELGNKYYDRMADALRETEWSRRSQLIAEVVGDLEAMVAEVNDESAWRKQHVPSMRARVLSEQVARILLVNLFTGAHLTQKRQDLLTQNLRNHRVAIALFAWYADHQTYPQTLAELTPEYLSAIPDDLFSSAPPIYRRSETGFMLYSIGPNGVDDGGIDLTDDRQVSVIVSTPAEAIDAR